MGRERKKRERSEGKGRGGSVELHHLLLITLITGYE